MLVSAHAKNKTEKPRESKLQKSLSEALPGRGGDNNGRFCAVLS
ncbi:unnamed protein product [Amoebophrya sp. A25]|nr:unnamed protein product [Amoebophrya sp. A25]|eukprot:GSA25T00006166001.1